MTRKRIALVLGAAAVLSAGGSFFRRELARRQEGRALAVVNAQLALQTLGRLNHAFRRRAGFFAPNLETLLMATGREKEFRQVLPQALDMATLKVTGNRDSFLIEAQALDPGRTKVTVRNAR